MLRHVTHYYFINFIKGLFPLASEAHCGYTSLHKYVITISIIQVSSRYGHRGQKTYAKIITNASAVSWPWYGLDIWNSRQKLQLDDTVVGVVGGVTGVVDESSTVWIISTVPLAAFWWICIQGAQGFTLISHWLKTIWIKEITRLLVDLKFEFKFSSNSFIPLWAKQVGR